MSGRAVLTDEGTGAGVPDALARFQAAIAQAEAVGIDLELDQIPDALGSLERVRERLRFRAYSIAMPADRLVEVAEAAGLLSMAEDTLYRKAGDYPFTVREGRSVLFSFLGIQKHIRSRQGKG